MTVPGDWHRETDQTIREVSAARTVEADKETRKVIDREITVQADDSKTVLGTARTTAGAVTHIARGDYTVGTSASLKTAAVAADEKIVEGKTVDIGGAMTERIAGVRQSVSAALQLQAATTSIGTAETNILTLLIDTLDLIDSLAQHTAGHTHSNTGTPTNAAKIAQTSVTATQLKGKYSPSSVDRYHGLSLWGVCYAHKMPRRRRAVLMGGFKKFVNGCCYLCIIKFTIRSDIIFFTPGIIMN